MTLSVPSYFVDDAISKTIIAKFGAEALTEKMVKHELDGASRQVFRKAVREGTKDVLNQAKASGVRMTYEEAKKTVTEGILIGIKTQSERVPIFIGASQVVTATPFATPKEATQDLLKDELKKDKK